MDKVFDKTKEFKNVKPITLYDSINDKDADGIISNLISIRKHTNDTYQTEEAFLTSLGKKYLAGYIAEHKNGVYVREDLIKYSEAAIKAQQAEILTMQKSTFAAKAATVAKKGLALAGSMVASALASFVVEKAIEGLINTDSKIYSPVSLLEYNDTT